MEGCEDLLAACQKQIVREYGDAESLTGSTVRARLLTLVPWYAASPVLYIGVRLPQVILEGFRYLYGRPTWGMVWRSGGRCCNCGAVEVATPAIGGIDAKFSRNACGRDHWKQPAARHYVCAECCAALLKQAAHDDGRNRG